MSPVRHTAGRRLHAATSRHALMAVGIMLAAPLIAPTPAAAQSGVKTLVDQAQYWQGKGRGDLATQAWRRVLMLDPGNAAAHRALSGGAPTAAPAPAFRAAPVAMAPQHAAPRAAQHPRPAPAAIAAAAPAPAQPRPHAAPAPFKRSADDIAGEARLTGFHDLQDNDLDHATHAFQSALAHNRHDSDALGGLGLVALKQSRFAQARDLLNQASAGGNAAKWREALETAQFFAELQDAQDLVARGQIAAAQAKAETLAHSGSSQAGTAVALLADIYAREGRYAEAADLYRQSGQGDSAAARGSQARAARSAALAAEARGDDLGAEQAFQQGLALDQQDPWIRYEFARFMIKRGRVGESESLISSLANSGDAEAIYAAAMLNSDLGRGAQAQRLIDRVPADALTPPMKSFAIGLKVDSAIQRAQILAAQGQKAEATAALRTLAATPGLAAGKVAAIADALTDLGDSYGAAGLAQQALAGQVTDLGGYEAILHVAARTGREDLAHAALARANQLAAGDPQGQHQVAEMTASAAAVEADHLRLSGQFAQAFDVLQGAWGGAPENADLLASLARLYQTGHMNARAAQTFQLLLQHDPHNRDALAGLMETAQAAGDRNLSQQAETNLFAAYPDSYQTYLAAAHVEAARGNSGNAVRYYKHAREMYLHSRVQEGDTSIPAGGNPFGGAAPAGVADGGAGDGNPFRSMPQAAVQAAPAVANPFNLGGGTRLPTVSQSYEPGLAYPAMPAQAPAAYQPAAYGGSAGGAAVMTDAAYTAPQGGGFAAAQTAAPQGGYEPSDDPGAGPRTSPMPGGFIAQTYPNGVGNQPGAQVSYQSAGGYAPVPSAAANPFMGAGGAGFVPGQTSPGPVDPVLAGIQQDIAKISQDNGPRFEGNTTFRSRAGEEGLSKLDEVVATGKFSTGLGRGRVYAQASEVMIDAGRPTDSALQRFGTEATIEAQSIVNAKAAQLVNAASQHAQGLAASVGYADNVVQVEAGTTPIGMGKTKPVWRIALTPKITDTTRLQAWFERKPVTDSIVSYAGTTDPVSGERWGQVMRTGGGVGFATNTTAGGAYLTVAYNKYQGLNTPKNHNVEVNGGGYLNVMQGTNSKLTAGVNFNYQKYANNQDEFTYGAGGYFSPQRFVAIGFPVNYTLTKGKLEVKASATPGFQSFSQAKTNVYTTDASAQASLDAMKADDSDVRNYYDSLSKTGFGVSTSAQAWYSIGQNTKIGGEASYNTFGNYNEVRMMLGIRQALGSGK